MIRVTLTTAERAAVVRQQRAVTLPLRARCQMVLLSADGWAPSRIAHHLAFHPHTVVPCCGGCRRAVWKGWTAG